MEKIVREEPKDTVVVEKDRDGNGGLIVAVVALIIVLLVLFFGVQLFSGDDGDTDVNVPAPTTTEQQ